MSDHPGEPRRPLRPLAPILRARERGENPDLIERLYRAMMECYIAYEHAELARLRAAGLSPKKEESV